MLFHIELYEPFIYLNQLDKERKTKLNIKKFISPTSVTRPSARLSARLSVLP
jgi:hypothetical protein